MLLCGGHGAPGACSSAHPHPHPPHAGHVEVHMLTAPARTYYALEAAHDPLRAAATSPSAAWGSSSARGGGLAAAGQQGQQGQQGASLQRFR